MISATCTETLYVSPTESWINIPTYIWIILPSLFYNAIRSLVMRRDINKYRKRESAFKILYQVIHSFTARPTSLWVSTTIYYHVDINVLVLHSSGYVVVHMTCLWDVLEVVFLGWSVLLYFVVGRYPVMQRKNQREWRFCIIILFYFIVHGKSVIDYQREPHMARLPEHRISLPRWFLMRFLKPFFGLSFGPKPRSPQTALAWENKRESSVIWAKLMNHSLWCCFLIS